MRRRPAMTATENPRPAQAATPTRQIFILVTVFLDVLGFGLIIPVLPLLIGQFTSGPDQQAHWFGMLGTAYGIVQFFFTPILGALSDSYGRRPVLLVSLFVLACSLLAQGLATSLLMLLVIRLISGMAGASLAVANAYMADISKSSERGEAFGSLGAAFGLGLIVGPMLGGLLGGNDVRLPFLVGAGISFANWLYGSLVLPESLPPERRAKFSLRRANPFSALLHLGRLSRVGGLVGSISLSIFAQSIMQMSWVLYTQFRFGWGPRQIGVSLFLIGIISTLVQGGLQGWLTRRLGEERLVLVGLASSVVGLVLYGLASAGWMIYLVIIANALSFATGPALQAIVSRSVSESELGLTQGAVTSINSVAMIFAPLLGTSLLALVARLDAHDWRFGLSFYVCAALQLLALGVAWWHFHQEKAAIA